MRTAALERMVGAVACLALSAACGTNMTEIRSDGGIAAAVRSGLRIRALDCAGDGITDDGLRALDGSENVESLWLRGCDNVHGTSFDVLARMPALGCVSIWNCPLQSETAFDFLRSTDAVSELILYRLRLGDEAFADIAAAKRLDILRLGEIDGLTDQGIGALASAKGLQTISIGSCPQVTDEAMDALRAALPDCRIEFVP